MRVVVMLMIIVHHYVVNSGLKADGGPLAENIFCAKSLVYWCLGAFGKTGTNVFILITGYFMCESKITIKKFAKLFAELTFYHFVVKLIFFALGYDALTMDSLIEWLLPINYVGYNFAGCFVLFYLFIPFLNILIHNLTEKQHILLLVLFGGIYVFFGTFKFIGTLEMNYIGWFSVLYLIAAYIRRYPKEIFDRKKFWTYALVVMFVMDWISIIGGAFIGEHFGQKNYTYYLLTDGNAIFAVTTAICIFMFFKNLKIKYTPVINWFGASTFGVLLLHTASDGERAWLWKTVFNCVATYEKPYWLLHLLVVPIVVFVICTVIDKLRIRFLEKPFLTWFDRKFENKISSVLQR